MSFIPVVHHMTKKAEGQGYRITAITPITRLSSYGEIVQLQGGAFYDAGGKPLEIIPGWAYDEMRKMSPAALKEAGFSAPLDKPKDAPEYLDPEMAAIKREEFEERRASANRKGRKE